MQDTITITPDSLKQEKPIQVPPVPQDTTNYAGIISGVSDSIAKQYEGYNSQLQTAQQNQQKTADAITGYLADLSGKTADLQQANEQAGVNAETQNVNKITEQLLGLNSQALQLNRESQAIPLQIQQEALGRGVTDRGVAPIETARLRDNAIKALSVAQQADVAQASLLGSQVKLQQAKEKAQQIVDLKYKPKEDLITALKAQYEFNKDFLSTIDKNRTEALNIRLSMESEMLKTQKENEKAISDMIIQASSQGADSNNLALASKAKTPAEAAMILGEYAGDYYKNQLLREQLKAARLENRQKGIEVDTMLSEMGLPTDSTTTLQHVLDAIALKESAGSGDYKALGPVVTSGMYKGQRALGRYQVMPGNLPQWSKEALGRVVTPQEFLDNPQLQDAIAGYQFTKNKEKYGTWEDAASVWFTGKPASQGANARDVLGTTGASYVQSFRDNLATVMGYTGAKTATNKFTNAAQQIIDGSAKLENFDSKDRVKISDEVARLKASKAGQITPQLQPLVDKLNTLDSIINDPYLGTAVGPNRLARISLTSGITGGKQNFLGSVANILDTQVLDTLINAKANGATFGALSEGELNLLKNSASKISNWAKRDKDGNITGFDVSEKEFKKELQNLQNKTKKALENAGVSLSTGGDTSFFDTIDKVYSGSTPMTSSSYANTFN